MDLHVRLHGPGDVAGQVYGQVRAAIAEGRLQPGEQLPSSRELARRLAVSRNTIGMAYDRLAAEGAIWSRVGAGIYVSQDKGRPADGPPVDSPLRARPLWDRVPEPTRPVEGAVEFDLRPGLPDVSRFPFSTWRALLAAQLRPSAAGTCGYVDAAGLGELRSAIARHVGVARGVRADADDVVVTSGSQQAVDLLARVLLEPGDTVALEDPGYGPTHRAFLAHGARVVGIPVDADGLVVTALPDTARLVCVTPCSQFPLGVLMSMERRRALLDWADRADATVVEDDYGGDFHFRGRPPEPLHRLDTYGRVVYVASLSTVMLPTLRLGFLVAPRPLHTAMRKAKLAADRHTDAPSQAAAAAFIEQGHLARHIRRMRALYATRHHLLRSCLDTELGPLLRLIQTAAGLHLAATFHSDVDDVAAVARARTGGVAVHPLSEYGLVLPARPGLVLGYAAVPTERIGEGVQQLRRCLEHTLSAPP